MRSGVLTGSVALIALEVILTSNQTGRIAQLFALPASWARLLIDPSVPAIPDHTAPTSTPSSTAPAPTPTPTNPDRVA